ncbi:MAG: hypothetical protein LBG75_03110 [Candidatus Nomurabacteria bacterium]|jgi:predicted outer membrane repeat protein|nr:hypothetical protein [Candidatus Nomurabacteria bacterium]
MKYYKILTGIVLALVITSAAATLFINKQSAQAAVSLTASNEAELKAAFANADTNIDITITADFELSTATTEGNRTVKNGKNITIHSDGTLRTIKRSASYAGRMILVQNGTLTLKDITIDGNKAGTSGLADVNTMILVGKSGSIADKGTLNIEPGATLQNNTATAGDSSKSAGAVVVREASTVNMSGGLITGNTGADRDTGGAFLFSDGDPGMSTPGMEMTFNMTGGEISGNTIRTKGGGGVYFQDKGSANGSNITITGSAKIINNIATNSGISNGAGGVGGGLFFSGNNKMNIEIGGSAEISGNTAGSNGGGLAINSQSNNGINLTVKDNAKFTGNTSNDGKGGGIYAENVDVRIQDNVEITDNTSTGGGGINLSGSQRGFVEIEGPVKINGNKVNIENPGSNNYGGGGVKLSGSNQHISIENGAQINNNDVYADNDWSGKGGGVYVSSCNDMYMYDSQVNGNITGNNSTNYWYHGANGGGIYFYGDYCNSSSTPNDARTLEIHNSQINNNTSGGQGGGIYTRVANLTFDNSQMNGNKARDNGGGIELHNWAWGSSYNMPSVNFTGDFQINNNIADLDEDGVGDGGGIFVNGWSGSSNFAINLSSGQINGNKAVGGGGIHFVVSGQNNHISTLTLGGNVQVNNNTAYTPEGMTNWSDAQGGAIELSSNSGWSLHITDNAQLTGNTAGWNGGAIHIGGLYNSSLLIDGNPNISGNKTLGTGCGSSGYGCYGTTGGGAIFIGGMGGTASADIGGNVKIDNNQAVNGFGGAIRVLNSPDGLYINDNAEICGNSAAYGGAISEHSGSVVYISGDVKLCDNVADVNGGAINLNFDSNSSVYMQDHVEIVDNTAGADGGGIWTEYPGLRGAYISGPGQDHTVVDVVDNKLTNVYVESGVKFWDNTAQAGYIMTDSADIATHGAQIGLVQYSWDFPYAYNNYDISYLSSDIKHVARVKFDVNGASSPTPATQYYWRENRSLAVEPSVPVRAGYKFLGWQGAVTTCNGWNAVLDEGTACTTTVEMWDFTSARAYADVKLTALWEEITPDAPNTGLEQQAANASASTPAAVGLLFALILIRRHLLSKRRA